MRRWGVRRWGVMSETQTIVHPLLLKAKSVSDPVLKRKYLDAYLKMQRMEEDAAREPSSVKGTTSLSDTAEEMFPGSITITAEETRRFRDRYVEMSKEYAGRIGMGDEQRWQLELDVLETVYRNILQFGNKGLAARVMAVLEMLRDEMGDVVL